MTYITSIPDTKYLTIEDDLRINLSSGILIANDGTTGGAPLSGIDYGLNLPLRTVIARPQNIEGHSLQRLMNEFPTYSRISHDKSSIGAQLLTPVSQLFDEVLDATNNVLDSRFLKDYPLYEQGVIYEWDFSRFTGITNTTNVLGLLGESSFDIPITIDEDMFWLSPPTRIETISSEISNSVILDWVQLASGNNIVLNTSTTLPVHNRPWIFISGSNNFRYYLTDDIPAMFPEVKIYGRHPNDSLRPGNSLKIETIPITRNGEFKTKFPYRTIEKIEVIGLPSGTYIKLDTFNFGARFRIDPSVKYQEPIRNVPFQPVFWHNVADTQAFSGITQPDFDKKIITSSNSAYLVKTVINSDSIYDNDIEFNTLDVWKLYDYNNTPLYGIIDIRNIPSTRYILALDNNSNIWTFDTYKPALNLNNKKEIRESPARIEAFWPLDNSETPENYTLSIVPRITNKGVGIQRWHWSLTHSGINYNINDNGTLNAYDTTSNWRVHSSGITDNYIPIAISGAGQYLFNLTIVDDLGERYSTYYAHSKSCKYAINQMPIRGLSINPSGIDFDYHGRLWAQTGAGAVRLVLRNDIGIWIEENILLTREPYDGVIL